MSHVRYTWPRGPFEMAHCRCGGETWRIIKGERNLKVFICQDCGGQYRVTQLMGWASAKISRNGPRFEGTPPKPQEGPR